jgi:DNA-binding winged helix-turn-helix (wHTH) protein/tetratricopeptide (TPR) repeat protein
VVYRFGDCELDETLYELRRAGHVVKTEPRVFDVLAFLLRHRDRVVSKDELLDALWPGEAVSESVLPRCVAAARRAVGDDRSAQRVIQTVHGRGYRFVAALRPSPGEDSSANPFVGRELILQRLGAQLARARSNSGRLVLLAGEPGIGKTRTAEEVAMLARSAGFRVFSARGFEAEGAPAFWLWTQILRAVIASTDRRVLLAAAGRGAADVAALVPEMPLEAGDAPSRGEGEQARFRLFESISQLLVRLAAGEPLVLFLDDLHWADADSLLLLQFLAPRLRGAAILLVGAYRDVDVRREHALAGTLASLAREAHCERVELRGLEPAAVAAMMEFVASVRPAPALAASVGRMTDGNPFFVRELTRLLADEGRLDEALEEDWSLALPQGVRDVIGRRLNTLSIPCNEMLRSAAALIRDFSVALLEGVVGVDRERLLECIEEALATRILVESSEATGHYAFAHALVRQTLYLELSAPQRVRLHRQIGQALEEAYGARVEEHLAELSYHFLQAAPLGEIERAVDYCTRAGERAHRQYAYEEAAHHYERALEVLDLDLHANDIRRCELVLALGETLITGGERDRGRERCREAAEVARALGRWDLFGKAALGLRGIGESGTVAPADSLSFLEEALEHLGDESNPGLRARLLSKLVQTPPYWACMETREKLSREAHALALRSGDSDALVEALGARWWACLGPDRLDERVAVARELSSGPRDDEPRTRMLALEIMRGVHLMRGELGLAQRAIDEFAELADEIRQPLWRFLAAANRASLAISQGEFAAVEVLLDDSLALGRGKVPYAEAFVVGLRLMLHSARGDELPDEHIELALGGLANIFGAATQLMKANVSRLIEASVLHSKLRSGKQAEVLERYGQLVARDFSDFERDENWLVAMTTFSELAGFLGDTARAEKIHALVAPYAELFVSHDLFGIVMSSVASVRCSLALTLGRLDEAVAFGQEAVARESAAGLAPALLWTRTRLATALERRARRGDAARARELRARLAAGARAIGSRHDYRAGR